MLNRQILAENIHRRLRSVVKYVKLTGDTRHNVARSDYNRAAVILACSVVEGLLCELILERSNPDPDPIIETGHSFKNSTSVSAQIVGGPDIFIGRKEPTELRVSDRDCTFGKMINFAFAKGYVSPTECRRLRYIKEKRNEIHLHTRNTHDIGYTGQTLDLIGEGVSFLINKL